MHLALRILLPIIILSLGCWYGYHMVSSPEEAEPVQKKRSRPTQQAEVAPLKRTDYQVMIQTRGVIQAHTRTSLTSRISGRIESFHPNFEVGAFFRRGDILVTLDPTDSEGAIVSAEAEVARAEAALVQEEARATQAKLNWEDLGYTEKPNDLVLRIPQMREVSANLKTAKANLEGAKRNRLYTQIIAPFDGCVRERLVGPGQSVGPNTPLGEIFATDYAIVRLPISPKDLPFTPFQTQSTLSGLPAILQDGIAAELSEDAPSWQAELVRSEGVIDENSRELFLIARITDPYGLQSGAAPLRVGQPVVAQVAGNLLEDVYIIPKTTLRGAFETLLVDNEDSTLLREKVDPFWTDEENLIIEHQMPENHSLVLTRIPIASNGTTIEVIQNDEKGSEEIEAAQVPQKEKQAPEA